MEMKGIEILKLFCGY